MKRRTLLFIAGFLALVQGCTSESVKRTSFETLQNIREEQCAKDLSGKCPPRETYDEYQSKLKEGQPSQ